MADGEEDTTGLHPQLEGPGGPPLEPAGGARTYPCDPRVLAVAGHLAAGGWIIIVHPWLISRPGRPPEIEMRAVGVMRGGMSR
jgi:hypothetical protein